MDYLEAMERLMGFVGHEVMVLVSGIDNSPPVAVVFRGKLRQGTKDKAISNGGDVSVFATDADPNLGLYVSRQDFRGAVWDDDNGVLSLLVGNTKIGISPK